MEVGGQSTPAVEDKDINTTDQELKTGALLLSIGSVMVKDRNYIAVEICLWLSAPTPHPNKDKVGTAC